MEEKVEEKVREQSVIKPGFLKSEFWLSVLWVGYTLFMILPKTANFDWFVSIPMMITSIGLVVFWIWKRNELYSSNFGYTKAKELFDELVGILGDIFETKQDDDKEKEE